MSLDFFLCFPSDRKEYHWNIFCFIHIARLFFGQLFWAVHCTFLYTLFFQWVVEQSSCQRKRLKSSTRFTNIFFCLFKRPGLLHQSYLCILDGIYFKDHLIAVKWSLDFNKEKINNVRKK